MDDYFEWIKKPEVQTAILSELDRIAGNGCVEPYMGICGNLAKAVEHLSPPTCHTAYDFISAHSDRYVQFDRPFTDTSYDKWEGENATYRRNWCKKLAQKLRDDPSEFFKTVAD